LTIDLSSSTEPRLAVAGHVLAEVAAAAGSDIPFMVIGATARDILSVAIVGAPPSRATQDVDVAIAVPSWQAFESVAAGLDRVGRREHTFVVAGLPVDIVPFGAIETTARTIDWRDGTRMSAFGLREAYDASLPALLPGGATLRVPSVAGLAMLKLMTWSDRRLETRRDAVDLQTIIGWYATGTLLDELYEAEIDLLEMYDFDPLPAAAHRLGREIAGVLGVESRRLLSVLDDDSLAKLVADMPSTVDDPISKVRALRAGLRSAGVP
jgi:predicted nucleotidyltransferase